MSQLLAPGSRTRPLWILAGCIWIALAVHSFASGEYREHSMVRRAADVGLGLIGIYILWDAWRARSRRGAPPR